MNLYFTNTHVYVNKGKAVMRLGFSKYFSEAFQPTTMQKYGVTLEPLHRSSGRGVGK